VWRKGQKESSDDYLQYLFLKEEARVAYQLFNYLRS